jgi:hypothetical protein
MSNKTIIEIQRRLLKLLRKEQEYERQRRQRLEARLVALQRAAKFISAN